MIVPLSEVSTVRVKKARSPEDILDMLNLLCSTGPWSFSSVGLLLRAMSQSCLSQSHTLGGPYCKINFRRTTTIGDFS